MNGDDIVKDFMSERKICSRDFFESRFTEHVALRLEAIMLLRSAGLNMVSVARAMHRSPQTIRYWVKAGRRKKELDRCRAKYASRGRGEYHVLAAALEEFYHDAI